jgi:hypothetical protein
MKLINKLLILVTVAVAFGFAVRSKNRVPVDMDQFLSWDRVNMKKKCFFYNTKKGDVIKINLINLTQCRSSLLINKTFINKEKVNLQLRDFVNDSINHLVMSSKINSKHYFKELEISD